MTRKRTPVAAEPATTTATASVPPMTAEQARIAYRNAVIAEWRDRAQPLYERSQQLWTQQATLAGLIETAPAGAPAPSAAELSVVEKGRQIAAALDSMTNINDSHKTIAARCFNIFLGADVVHVRGSSGSNIGLLPGTVIKFARRPADSLVSSGSAVRALPLYEPLLVIATDNGDGTIRVAMGLEGKGQTTYGWLPALKRGSNPPLRATYEPATLDEVAWLLSQLPEAVRGYWLSGDMAQLRGLAS